MYVTKEWFIDERDATFKISSYTKSTHTEFTFTLKQDVQYRCFSR